MKFLNTLLTGLILAVFIVGCGKEPKPAFSLNKIQRSVVAQSSCPLKFSQGGLCAEIHWMSGPSADKESSFFVTFWDPNTGSSQGPWVEPQAQVSSFIRMTCCGSVFFPTLSKAEQGKYLVSKVKFTPGKWEVYVQLKNGSGVEKQFISVNLDD